MDTFEIIYIYILLYTINSALRPWPLLPIPSAYRISTGLTYNSSGHLRALHSYTRGLLL